MSRRGQQLQAGVTDARLAVVTMQPQVADGLGQDCEQVRQSVVRQTRVVDIDRS